MPDRPVSQTIGPFSAVILAALGLNAWALLLLVPVLHGLAAPTRAALLPTWAVFAPLPFLAWGIGRLGRVLLLGIYPISLAVLHAAFQGPSEESLLTPLTFGLAALSLSAYLVGATIILEIASRRDDTLRRRRIARAPLTPKWRRRRRVYWLLAVFAAAIPVTLLYTVDFHPGVAKRLRADYGDGAPEMRTLLVLGVLALWVWLFSTFFLHPLEAHRRGDMDLRGQLLALRAPRAGSARVRLWLVVLLFTLTLGLLLWLRQRYSGSTL